MKTSETSSAGRIGALEKLTKGCPKTETNTFSITNYLPSLGTLPFINGFIPDCVSLQGLDVQQAHLAAIDLAGANLRSARLQDTGLWEADFTEADLKSAQLWRAKLGEAILIGANLERLI